MLAIKLKCLNAHKQSSIKIKKTITHIFIILFILIRMLLPFFSDIYNSLHLLAFAFYITPKLTGQLAGVREYTGCISIKEVRPPP